MDAFYDSQEWRALSERARRRDGNRCTVARLLGGDCRGVLHAHHVADRRSHPELALDLDNIGTACASHHPLWEALARILRLVQTLELPPCRHRHPYREGRIQCERRRREELLARRAGRLARV